MKIDERKVNEISLALLYLTTFKDKWGFRAWKGYSWMFSIACMRAASLKIRGAKAKSVLLTDEGVERSKALFEKHFAK